jgi:hypothetical protein
MIIDANDLDAAQSYKILIATVVPRAIGWISTLSKDGVPNLAPLFFFTVVGRKRHDERHLHQCPRNGRVRRQSRNAAARPRDG